jgi:hypothetical protein
MAQNRIRLAVVVVVWPSGERLKYINTHYKDGSSCRVGVSTTRETREQQLLQKRKENSLFFFLFPFVLTGNSLFLSQKSGQ